MDYWNESFGFYLALGSSIFYFVFLGVFYGIDQHTVPIIMERLVARVKKLELKGFRQKEEKKLTVYRDEKGKIVFIRHDRNKAADGEGVGKDGKSKDKAKKGIAASDDIKNLGEKQYQEDLDYAEADAVIELK